MTRWPTWFEIHVCATPITPLITASAIIPPTSHESRVRLPLWTSTFDRFAQQERRGDAQDRTEHDQPEQQAQAQAVGDEQPADAPQRDVFVGDVLGRGAGAAGSARRERPPPPPPCP